VAQNSVEQKTICPTIKPQFKLNVI